MQILCVILLLGVLAFAVGQPRGWPEAVVAAPAAIIVIAIGAISPQSAASEVMRLAPVVGFLAAVLVLAQLCDNAGLFHAAGTLMARTCACRPQRLLFQVFGIAAVTTAILSLDATVVLLTPVVFATASELGARTKPYVYACTHLANSASLLLPVSNLTNLLAFATAKVSFLRFAALMAMPWLVAVATEYLIFRRFFSIDLSAGADERPVTAEREVPLFVLVVVAVTLGGFALSSFLGINPAWVAFGSAVVLASRALMQRCTTVVDIVRAASPSFGVFVLALGIVVRAVMDNGLTTLVGHVIPHGSALPALLGLAALAAVLANMINNLPAVLALLPLAAPQGTGAILAVLIGVNIGPNFTYVGSLATLLWRRIVREHDTRTNLGEFTRLGALTVPAALLASVLALRAGLSTFGD